MVLHIWVHYGVTLGLVMQFWWMSWCLGGTAGQSRENNLEGHAPFGPGWHPPPAAGPPRAVLAWSTLSRVGPSGLPRLFSFLVGCGGRCSLRWSLVGLYWRYRDRQILGHAYM